MNQALDIAVLLEDGLVSKTLPPDAQGQHNLLGSGRMMETAALCAAL